MERLVGRVELAAGGFLALIATVTFVSVALRWAINWPIPDGYDISRLLLGIAMFWGIAVACWHGRHIQVDGLWEISGPGLRRLIDLFATTVTFGFFAVFAWMVASQVLSTFNSHERTFDLRLPVWPFYMLAAAGAAVAALMLGLRILRLTRR